VAGIFIFANQPAPPEPPCQPGEFCAPPPSLPPIAVATPTPTPGPGQTELPATPAPSGGLQTPAPSGGLQTPGPVATPESNAPPVLSGTLFKDDELGFSFEYDPEVFTLADSAKGSAVLNGVFFDAVIWVDVVAADTSPSQQIADELEFVDRFLLGRVADEDAYDALLGPSIGYVAGEGNVYSGTLVSRDGTPLEPGAVAVVASTDGRLTAAVVVIVGSPDLRRGGETQAHAVRSAADDIVKTFNWNAQ